MWELQVKFYWGNMRIAIWETDLRYLWETDLKRYRGRTVYMWFGKKGVHVFKHIFFCRKFLLISWAMLVMKNNRHHEEFCVFLDMKRYKYWAHKISSWDCITIWRPALPVFPKHKVPHSCSPHWTPSGGVEHQQLHSTWFNHCRGRWQALMASANL